MIPDSWTSQGVYFAPPAWAVILALPLVWPLYVTIAVAVLTKREK